MWRGLSEKFESLKEYFLNRSPRGKWLFVRDVGISILRITGAHAIDPNFRIYWLSYIPGVTAFMGFVSFLYTIWYYSDTNPLKGYLFLPMFAIVVPSTILYVLIMIPKTRKEFRDLIFFAGEKVYPDYGENTNPEYIKVIDRSAVKLMTNTAKIVAIVVFSMIIYLIFPIVVYIQSKELHLPIPTLVPFTDLESKNGIIINLCNQSSIAVMIIIGNIGIEMITCMMKNTVWAICVAICHTIDEISKFVEKPKPAPDNTLDWYVRNLSMQVLDLNSFISSLSELYYYKFFLQPMMLTLGVALAFFFHLYGIWKCGLGISLLFYAQLYILCDIGNEVDSANKMLMLKMHEMPWYLLSQKNQMAHGFILLRLQDMAVLRMGPFAELNFETLTDMTKLIYSVLMMLIRVLE